MRIVTVLGLMGRGAPGGTKAEQSRIASILQPLACFAARDRVLQALHTKQCRAHLHSSF